MDKQSGATKTTTIDINISGMSCSGCAASVQQALDNIDGVKEAAVDLENNSASVTYNPNAITEDDFERAVQGAGYGFKGARR
ncbi:Copper chaperone CopZ [Fodinibius roseus]|uniref:Copper chaperone CopZ n=1 Tax=Fodinibius roseus TaxID=1194090 RepID=A0A1M4UXC5_9BACT|nr:heavy-metal-associated domain-containing protein [Fodinibius roseus]SHE61283.1 Copper chaperone CopZ [Fodinibius roseus]